MTFPKQFISAILLLLVTGIFSVPSSQAQSTFLRKTHVTFSGPVEIPGRVLPAGTYTFQLNVLPSNETSVVQILNEDGTKTLANVLTIPDYRLKATGKTVITFSERAANNPEALRAWFYPGENFGHEFAYPKKRAEQLALANRVNVPEIPDETTDTNLQSAKVTQAAPNETQTEVAQVTQPPAQSPAPVTNNRTSYNSQPNYDSQSNNLVASNRLLPKTASPVFSIALLGVLFLSIGVSLGVLRRVTLTGDREHRS